MIRLIHFLALTVLVSHLPIANSYCQIGLGTGGGLTYNNLKFNNENENVKIVPRVGLSLFLIVDIPISKRLDLDIEPGFIEKNYKKQSIYNRQVGENICNTYIQMPVNFRVNLKRNKKAVFISSGISVGYWVKSEIEARIPNIFNTFLNSNKNYFELIELREDYIFDSLKDNRLEIALNIGIGRSFIIKKSELLVNFRFIRSLSGQEKKYMLEQQERANQTFSMSITYFRRIIL